MLLVARGITRSFRRRATEADCLASMAEKAKIQEFPDISNKLQAPTKKSVFERQKAEAEAKRQRDQEETAAAYDDFVKSFDDDGNGSESLGGPGTRGEGFGRGTPSGGGFSKKHFSGAPSGPAGRGGRGSSGPGSLGPAPQSLSRKRTRDGIQPAQRGGLFAFDDASAGPADPKTLLQHSDDEDVEDRSKAQDRAVPKPTLRLSLLPPGTSPAAIKAIIPTNLTIDGVKILPPPGPSTTERRSVTAIVTLAKDTPALDIDAAVSALQNRYMGRGFNLAISRHLSTAVSSLDAPSAALTSSSSSLPFNARPIAQPNMSRSAHGGPHRGGYAPPTAYTPGLGRGLAQTQVNVTPPSDLRQLRLIHKTLESLLEHGPEFEALLMSRKEVQTDERWSWIWDARSSGGVYYRWRLWDLLTGFSRRARRGRNLGLQPQQIFESSAAWAVPDQKLPFEYTTRLDEFISDSEYDSSEDEDSGDEGRRRYAQHHGGAPPPDGPSLDIDQQSYLNPMQRAKLTHLLARLPNSNAKLRRGDVARVTAFAIQHSGEGADEVVQMIVSNVHQPFSFTSANPERLRLDAVGAVSTDDKDEIAAAAEDEKKPTSEDDDSTPAKMIALYLISDILSTSSTSGVRHAWRYRSLFEAALKAQGTFEHLGRLDKSLNWGRLRAEKWKRSINSVLGLWEGWCVFPQGSQEHFANVFANPPLTAAEEAAKVREEKEREREKGKSKWKTVEDRKDDTATSTTTSPLKGMTATSSAPDAMDVDMIDDDIDGAPMADEDEDEDNNNNNNEDLDGIPMQDEDDDSPPPPAPPTNLASTENDHQQQRRSTLAASIAAKLSKATSSTTTTVPNPNPNPPSTSTIGNPTRKHTDKDQDQEGKEEPSGLIRKRQRPRAEDMFAEVNSDEE